MSPRVKKLIATLLIILVWLPVYALVVMGLAVHVLPQRALVCEPGFLCPGRDLWIVADRPGAALDVPRTAENR